MIQKFCFVILCNILCFGLAKATDYYAYKTAVPPVIDGLATESCWQSADWVVLDQVWVGHKPISENCSARYKACWNGSKIYVLMEVVDNILVNWNPTEPLKNYPSNDCPELFIDEDNSGGEHERSYNAFAYHISTLYDIVDMDIDGNAKLYNDHIEVKRTASGTTYTWEMAMTVFNDKVVYGNIESQKVILSAGKVLGFTAAYNDSDTKFNEREAMLASVEIAPWKCSNLGYPNSGVNCSWQTASVFGKMTLKDIPLATEISDVATKISITKSDSGFIINGLGTGNSAIVKIYKANGSLIHQSTTTSQVVPLLPLVKGTLYLVVLERNGVISKHKINW